jgi:LEA14-like dessication related protein
MKNRRFYLFSLLFLCCLSCKSPPPPSGEAPVSELRFDRIEAENIDRVVLYYRLWADNPRTVPLSLKIRNWKASVDGFAYDRNGANLIMDEEISAEEALVEVPPGSSVEKTLRLELDLKSRRDAPADSGDSGDYQAELLVDLAYQYGRERDFAGKAAVVTAFPRIKRPEFAITEIAILQAELVNTRFRVTVRIDNPNMFPVNLSSLGYELYGSGRFWADGKETDVLYIPARDSSEVKLFLLMNFINMKRELLDEIIAMRQVRYRFSGEALVGTGISWLPEFRMNFDHSGRSDVFK